MCGARCGGRAIPPMPALLRKAHRAGGDFQRRTPYVVGHAERSQHLIRNSTRDRRRRGKAMIKVGDRIPSVKLKHMTSDGIKEITTDEIFKGKKVVLFALPGAFTPTCSAKHLPGFVQKAEDLRKKGMDTIACVSVNDAFVMGAWGENQGAGDRVMMLPDGNGELPRGLGLDMNATK